MAGYVDWIMDGHISELILQGKLEGRFCETLLLATCPKIKSPMCLIIGTGDPQKLSIQCIKTIARYTAKVVDGLKITHFGIYPHDLFLSHLDIFMVMKELIGGLKDSESELLKIDLLSNGHTQQEIITKWLQK